MGAHLDLDDVVAGHPKAMEELTTLRAENERLREALHPFAALAAAYDPDEGDDNQKIWWRQPTIGDVRRARAALTEKEGE